MAQFFRGVAATSNALPCAMRHPRVPERLVAPPVHLLKLFATIAVVAVAGCSDGVSEPPPPTWHGDIRPLVQTSCVRCHEPGGVGPFSLTTYDEVSTLGPAVVQSVVSRRMPPWGHDESCRSAVGSSWLSDDNVDLLVRWEQADFPEGEGDDVAQPQAVADPQERRAPDVRMGLSMPYTLDTAQPDDYRCVLLDETFPRDTYVTLTDFFPDNAAVVHHVIVYVVDGENEDALLSLDAADPKIGWSCFGDSGIEQANWLSGWAPGGERGYPSADTAVRIPQGARLVMQLHYNVVAASPDALEDQSEFAIWTLPEGQTPQYLITTLPIPHYGIDIAPDDAASSHDLTVRLPLDSTIVGASPHMHLLGESIRMDLIRPDGSRECLSDVGAWDFNWQRAYIYPENAHVPASIADRFELECTYDNSAQNQPIDNGTTSAPKQVTWGEGSLDEMCLMTLILREPYFPTSGEGLCSGFRPCFDDCPPGDAFCPFACMTKVGVGCVQCGADGLFGNCAREECGQPAVDFGLCYLQCPLDDADPYTGFTCMYERCFDRFADYYACLEPMLRNGECADDWSTCGGVMP